MTRLGVFEYICLVAFWLMGLAPKALWVNMHNNCFHLWEAEELKTKWIMDQM